MNLEDAKPKPVYAREYNAFAIPKPLDDDLHQELEHLRKATGQDVEFRMYLLALLQTAVERERQGRLYVEEQRAKDNLVQPAGKLILPPFAAEAAARARAAKVIA